MSDLEELLRHALVRIEQLESRLADMEASQLPVGAIAAWDDRTGAPMPKGWHRCDGQTVDVGGGRAVTLPDLNTSGRFLRGGTHAGQLQGSQIETHTHHDAGHTHGYTEEKNNPGRRGRHGWLSHGQEWMEPGTTGVGHAQLGPPVGAAHGSETRPINMSVVWIMRLA